MRNYSLFLWTDIDQGLFDQIDEDKDGLINVDEFRKYLTAKQIEKDEIDVKTLFDTLDEDKDGKINIDGKLPMIFIQ